MEFFEEILGSEMKRTPTNTRVIELNIPKKESKWWPRLLKEKGKVGFLAHHGCPSIILQNMKRYSFELYALVILHQVK